MTLVKHTIEKLLKGLTIGCCLLGYACIDEIQLDNTGGSGNRLVVQGQLLAGESTSIKVSLSRTADFEAQSVPEPVGGAMVTLENQAGETSALIELANGKYQLNSGEISMPIVPGDSYRINVLLNDGASYQSSFESLRSVPQPDSISINIVQREELNELDELETKSFVQFLLHSSIQGSGEPERAFMKWGFESIYRLDENPPPDDVPGPGPGTCFITRGANLGSVLVFNGNEANGSTVSNFLLLEEEIDVRFSLGFLMNVSQQSLSPAAFQYWDQVSKTVGLSGGLFEATPGRISGNVTNLGNPEEEVLGFFYVSEEQIVRKFVTPDEAGRPDVLCGPGLDEDSDACNNCLSVPFSTLTIPEGWEQ